MIYLKYQEINTCMVFKNCICVQELILFNAGCESGIFECLKYVLATTRNLFGLPGSHITAEKENRDDRNDILFGAGMLYGHCFVCMNSIYYFFILF